MRAAAFVAALVLVLAPLAANASDVVRQTISGKTIAAMAAQELAHLAHGPQTTYTPASAVPDQIVSDGQVHLRAQSPIGSMQFVNVPVQIEVNGRLDRTVLVGYRVRELVDAAVATHDLVPGTVIAPEDVEMGHVPFTGQHYNGTDVVIGRRLVGAALKGAPVMIGDTQVNDIVKAGSTIVFTIRNGAVIITADAIARTGGGMGEQVVVFNPTTHKQLTGTVTGPNAVELDITEASTP